MWPFGKRWAGPISPGFQPPRSGRGQPQGFAPTDSSLPHRRGVPRGRPLFVSPAHRRGVPRGRPGKPCRNDDPFWIPASAGMTGAGGPGRPAGRPYRFVSPAKAGAQETLPERRGLLDSCLRRNDGGSLSPLPRRERAGVRVDSAGMTGAGTRATGQSPLRPTRGAGWGCPGQPQGSPLQPTPGAPGRDSCAIAPLRHCVPVSRVRAVVSLRHG